MEKGAISNIAIRITEAYLAKVNLGFLVGTEPKQDPAEQGKKLGELYAAVYKAVEEAGK